MENTFTAPSGKEVVLREGITRAEDKKIKAVLYKGAKANAKGDIDPASVVNNVEDQKDFIVDLFVVTYGGEEINAKVISSMPAKDFDFCFDLAYGIYQGIEQKKS